MRRSQAAKYARWSAAAALLLASITAGVYVNRKWVAHRERAKAPPPAPQDVTRLSSGLTFSKVEGNQKIFTVDARKATDFKDKSASLMEDVVITIFGKTGARHDLIHTQSCQYEKDGASIVCSGEVQLDLQSAEDAERGARNRAATEQKVHVETRAVIFDRKTGVAESDQPVTFVFPGGRGEAVGVEYHSEEGGARLLRNVRFTLNPSNAPQEKNGRVGVREPVHISAESADFERDSRAMHLHGAVEGRTGTASLSAGQLTLTLDMEFRAERLIATAGGSGKDPELASRSSASQANLSGQTLTAYFAPEGWLTRIEGAGRVRGTQRSASKVDDLSAENAVLELRPKISQPKELLITGQVQLKSKAEKKGEERSLQTSALVVQFAQGRKGEGAKPQRAETLAAGALEWIDPAPQPAGAPSESGIARTKLSGDKLELRFDAQGKANQLLASGHVSTEKTMPGKQLQTATAQNGTAQLLERGGWSQMELQGSVNLAQGERNGKADRAVFVRSAQTATLTGSAMVRDATTETYAPRIIFAQNSGEIRADGGVRSTDLSAKGSGLQLAAAPANISADTLRANSKTSRALYAGHARLWQGDSVMEAESIELLRETKILNAWGNVRAVFPQAPGQTPVPAQPLALRPRAPSKAKLWHVSAGTLTYSDTDATAHLEENVVAKSVEQEMRAQIADLYFTRADQSEGLRPGTAASPNSLAGARQISRAVGKGGVTVTQGARKASAERGEYSAADGKFIMTGGQPTIFDAAEGTTTGRQLTFFLADDTIIVDSENGSRTLTKHRVEK